MRIIDFTIFNKNNIVLKERNVKMCAINDIKKKEKNANSPMHSS